MSYCSSCGSPIPNDQGSSCSMCYGDPEHGHDRYYQEWLRQRESEEEEMKRQVEEAAEQYWLEKMREETQYVGYK